MQLPSHYPAAQSLIDPGVTCRNARRGLQSAKRTTPFDARYAAANMDKRIGHMFLICSMQLDRQSCDARRRRGQAGCIAQAQELSDVCRAPC